MRLFRVLEIYSLTTGPVRLQGFPGSSSVAAFQSDPSRAPQQFTIRCLQGEIERSQVVLRCYFKYSAKVHYMGRREL